MFVNTEHFYSFNITPINPLVNDPLYLVCIAKISTSKKRRDHRTNFQ